MSTSANIDARWAFTRSLSGSPQLTAAEAEKVLFGHVYAEDKLITNEQLLEAAMAVAARFGASEHVVLMQRFGVGCVNDLFVGLRRRFIGFCDAVMKYNLPPSYSFVEDRDEYTFKPIGM